MKKEACVIFSKQCDGDIVLGKVRDRMYDPEICIYHLELDGTEICVMFDRITGFCEGINEHGIGIVNSSLMVLQDEREGVADGDSGPERSPDGIKIIKALSKKTVPEALRSLISYKPARFQRGLKGHTLVTDGKKVYALENSRIHTPKVLKLTPEEVHTRTNHGIYYPGAGYTKGDDYISSIVRQWEAKKQLEKVQRAEDLMPALTQSIEKTNGSMNPVRFTDKMRTTSQMVANPAKGEMLLYLVPGHSKFEGIRNLLPGGRKPKMKVRVFKYPSKKQLKDPYVTVPDEMESASAHKSLKRQIMAERVAARYKSKKKVKTKDGDEMTVYEYSDRQVADRNRKKAERIEKLRKSMEKLRTKVRKDVQSKDEKLRDVALAVGLMDETFERVGNDGSAKDGHFGVTTWRVKHVKFSHGSVTISYVGKSGVDQKKKITNSRVVSALKRVCKDKKPNDCVLSVSASDVNKYLKPFGVSAKDIRGFHANEEMKIQLKKVRKGKLPADPKERAKKLKDEFKAALEIAAERVGHEPSTLKSQYLVPGLEDDYMKDGTVSESHTRKQANLRDVAAAGTPTERRILANAIHAPVLVGRARSWWLREAPNLYRIARDQEKPRPEIPGLRFDPQLFTVLWYEDDDGNRYEMPEDGPDHPEGSKYQYSRFPNTLHDSILELNDDGTSSEILRGESGFSSDLVTAMVRSNDWDVGDAIMVAGQSCERCMNVLGNHYGLDWGYPVDSEEYRKSGTTCSMCEHRGKTGTKSESEKEDEQVQKMLRKEPKKKPPRYDLRDNRTLDEEEEENLGGGDKGDRDLSMKWNKVGHRVAWRWLAVPATPSPVRVAFHRVAEAGAPGAPQQEAPKQQAPTFEEWVKEKRWPSKAKNAPPGAEVGFEGLKKQDPAMADKVRQEYARLFPGAGDKGGDKKKKEEEPKERSREDIDADLESARNDRDELEDTVQALESQIKEHERNIQKLKEKAKKPSLDPEARKEKIQGRIDEEKQKMRDSVEQMQSLGNEMDKHEDRIDDLTTEIKEQGALVKDLKGLLKQLPEDHERREDLEGQISEARAAIREAKGQLRDEKKTLADKEKNYNALRDSGRQAAKAVKFLEGKLEEDVPEEEDPQAQLKEERRKLDEAQEELKEKKEDLDVAEQRVNELKAERKDPTGAKRQQEEAQKREKEKRTREAILQTQKTMESLMGKGSGLPRHVKAEIEEQIGNLSEDEMEQFAVEFARTLQGLTEQDPTSDDAVSVANAMAKSGFSTQGVTGAEDLAERVAKIAYTRNVIANPMIAGGTPVGQTPMDPQAYGDRALEGYNQFARLNGILRREAASQIADELRGLDPETDRAQELEAILTGINTAHIADTGESLPGQPQVSKGSAALIRKMSETGNIAQMFRPSQDLFADESRQAMRNALNNMDDDELADFMIGEDANHPFRRLKTILQNAGPGGSEYKQLVKSFLIDDWMNDVWGDRATRDVMEAAGAADWDDPEVRARIMEEAKAHGGPRRQQAFEAMVRIDEARSRGERPDPEDQQLVQDVLGEGGQGLREQAKSLLDTLKGKFNKWVISPATAVFKNFVETGDKSVMDSETLPHPDTDVPEPRPKEQREKQRAEAQRDREEGQQDQGSKYTPEQVAKARERFTKYREKFDKAKDTMSPKQRERVQSQIDRMEQRLQGYESGGDAGEKEQPEDKDHKAGEVWRTDQGNWRAKNREGVPKSFKDKDKAEQYAKGKGAPEGRGELENEGFSADFSIPVEDRGPTRFASDKVAELWLARVRAVHPDDPNRPFIVVEAA